MNSLPLIISVAASMSSVISSVTMKPASLAIPVPEPEPVEELPDVPASRPIIIPPPVVIPGVVLPGAELMPGIIPVMPGATVAPGAELMPGATVMPGETVLMLGGRPQPGTGLALGHIPVTPASLPEPEDLPDEHPAWLIASSAAA